MKTANPPHFIRGCTCLLNKADWVELFIAVSRGRTEAFLRFCRTLRQRKPLTEFRKNGPRAGVCFGGAGYGELGSFTCRGAVAISQPSGVWRPPVFRHRCAAGGVSYAYSVRHAPAPVLFPARQGRKSDFRLRIALRIRCAAATEASPTAPGNRRMPFRRALPACTAPSAVCGYGLRRRVLPFPALFSQRFCSRKCKKFEKRLTRR